MTTTIDPNDDLLHPVTPEPDFMETNYYNAFDQQSGVGGFFRLGNRVNEGWAEMTVCIFLPDGSVGFMGAKPPIVDNDVFEAGGLRFDILEPFKRQRLRYQGRVVLLRDPTLMVDPKAAFAESPHVDCRFDLAVSGMCEPWQPPEVQGWSGEGTGHNEQLTAVTGSLTVGDQRFDLDGFGIRDHSWGPRTWQKVCQFGRWFTGPLAPDFAFMGFYMMQEGSAPIDRGFVWDGDTFQLCDRFEIESTTYDEDYYQQAIVARLGCGDREWRVEGEVLNLIPLRHKRGGEVTRICEGLTRWTVDGERTGYGLSEYMDQMIDGRPSGA